MFTDMHLLSGKRWFSWPRVACLVVTAFILFLIFRGIDSAAFLISLKQMRLTWFALALAAYGLALWLGSFRWHFALRLTDRAIHPSASYRLFLIGHFFFVVLFGVAGGDLAKTAPHARHFPFGLPESIA